MGHQTAVQWWKILVNNNINVTKKRKGTSPVQLVRPVSIPELMAAM